MNYKHHIKTQVKEIHHLILMAQNELISYEQLHDEIYSSIEMIWWTDGVEHLVDDFIDKVVVIARSNDKGRVDDDKMVKMIEENFIELLDLMEDAFSDETYYIL